jgi:hypothetical protein
MRFDASGLGSGRLVDSYHNFAATGNTFASRLRHTAYVGAGFARVRCLYLFAFPLLEDPPMLPLRAVLAGSLLFATTAATQPSSLSTAPQADTTVPALKSPAAARVIGIIPGAGHMYAGEVGRGFLYLGGTFALVVAAGIASVAHCIEYSLFDSDPPDCDQPPETTLALIAAGGLWVWSIFDAARAAQRTNAKRAARVSPVIEPTRKPDAHGDNRSAVRLGVHISTW